MTRVKTARPIRAILFDKDGTLVDFQGTGGPAVHAVMQALAAGRRAIYERLATASGFVESDHRFLPDSLLVAQSTNVRGPLWAEALGCDADPHFLAEVDRLLCEATTSHLVPIGKPQKLMAALAGRGYRLGVVSNDAEITVRAHARKRGIDRILQFVAGYDSGLAPAREAGAIAVGVLTGPAPAATVVPDADAILASAEELLTWLDQR